MNMRWVVLLALLPILFACDAGSDQDAASQTGAESAASSSSADGAKWRVEYSGDLDGRVSGSIMSVAGIGTNTILAGAAMNEDSTGAADHNFRATITRYGDEPTTSFSLTLADGTRCFDVTGQDPEPSSVTIQDAEKDTFRAEIRGTMHCGEEKDKRIEFTAFIDADA